jgi:hypothetical protein
VVTTSFGRRAKWEGELTYVVHHLWIRVDDGCAERCKQVETEPEHFLRRCEEERGER